MEQSEAERQLLQLLRGLGCAEFTLRIAVTEVHAGAGVAGARGWHLSYAPAWTVTLSTPQTPASRTTSGTSFAAAWSHQQPCSPTGPRRANEVAGPGYRDVMSADAIARAEQLVLAIVRGETDEVAITVSVKAGRWIVNLRAHDQSGQGSIGDGASFADAWWHDWPWWRDVTPDVEIGR
jgi:hypothetical protein